MSFEYSLTCNFFFFLGGDRFRFLAIVDGRVPPSPGMLVMKEVMVAKGDVKAKGAEAIAKLQHIGRDKVFASYLKHRRLVRNGPQKHYPFFFTFYSFFFSLES